MKDIIACSDKKKFVLTFIFNIIQSISSYGIPFAFTLYATDPLTLDKMYSLTIVLIIMFAGYLIGKYGYYYNAEVYYYKLQINTEKYYFDKLTKMNVNILNNNNTGYITSIIKEHAIRTTFIVSDIAEVYIPLILGLGSFLYITFKQSISMGFIFTFIFILIVLVRYKMTQQKKKYIKKYTSTHALYKGAMIDFISNIKTIIKLNSTNFAKKKIIEQKENSMKDLKECCKSSSRIETAYSSMINSVHVLSMILAFYSLLKGIDVVAYLMFYITIIEKLNYSLTGAATSIGRIINYNTTKEQLNEIIGNLEEKEYIEEFNKYEIIDGKFTYPNSNNGITIPKFTIRKKDKICIMGESGQGKSTLLNILSGILNLDSGEIFINDDIANNKIIDSVVVSQEIDVFNMSIRDNLLLGKNIPENKITEIFEEAGLLDWYQALPNGLDEKVGEKGIKLSVGQKQRINIIRGLLNDKELYIFDEPTSNLDKESEEKITYLIEKYLKNKTYIIVTHREKLKSICNKNYSISNHTLEEVD